MRANSEIWAMRDVSVNSAENVESPAKSLENENLRSRRPTRWGLLRCLGM